VNALFEKWRTQSTVRKVLWSLLALFIVLTVVGAALPGSSKKSNRQTRRSPLL
jgi:hypothetical protein